MSVTREEVRKYTERHIEWLNSQKVLYGDDPDLVADIEVHTALLAALDDVERIDALADIVRTNLVMIDESRGTFYINSVDGVPERMGATLREAIDTSRAGGEG